MPDFEAEIALAEAARRDGNEGRARVCARRAAGIAARAYLEARGQVARSRSAYDQLRALEGLADLPAEVRRVAGHFLLKVDEAYRLPIEADLIAEARWLAQQLLIK